MYVMLIMVGRLISLLANVSLLMLGLAMAIQLTPLLTMASLLQSNFMVNYNGHYTNVRHGQSTNAIVNHGQYAYVMANHGLRLLMLRLL